VLRVAGTIAAVAAALLGAGCGSAAATQESGSASSGRQLFIERCGSCHALADAGTQGAIGPDLDQAFAAAREHGFEESTIRDVVRGQIAYPTAEPVTGEPGMPANLVTGRDAADVAAYVAAVAAKPVEDGGDGQAAPPSDSKALFTQLCGACHVLADAGTTGTIGPNLDERGRSSRPRSSRSRTGAAACRPSAASSPRSRSAPSPSTSCRPPAAARRLCGSEPLSPPRA
jgi:mono/diheme cytochrome c family protein